ncbi:MAG: sulfotransferase [Pelagibacteraceae bacterium]|nr:sulfotransferase [Pelagibacteraceae bacterium]MCI5078828.1 sulfotransferase [Pelagibacteraceae bacterium]
MQRYNFVDRANIKFFLGLGFIKRSIFEMEKIFFLPDNLYLDQNHVFITGFPRSGTTLVLNYIFETGEFASLTNRDVPYLFAPNLFNYRNKRIKKQKRIHGDEIYENLDSPGAYDNVFLNFFDGYEEIYDEYVKYISLVLKKYKKQKYISKNNYLLNKVIIIKKLYKCSKVILLFRNPIDHATSLLKQHLHFCKVQNEDRFILKYMDLMLHNEFGKGHISWHENRKKYNFTDLNYWLDQWIQQYEKILFLKEKNDDFILLDIKDFCNNHDLRINLKKKLGIQQQSKFDNILKYKEGKIFNHQVDGELLKISNTIYSKLSINAFK